MCPVRISAKDPGICIGALLFFPLGNKSTFPLRILAPTHNMRNLPYLALVVAADIC